MRQRPTNGGNFMRSIEATTIAARYTREYSREITLFYTFAIQKDGNNVTNAKSFDVNTVTILFFPSCWYVHV